MAFIKDHLPWAPRTSYLGARFMIGATLTLALAGAPALAQEAPPNNECSTGWCGTPKESGGGGGCGGGGGSILVNNTDDGKTYQHTDDWDADGVPDQIDNCPYLKNRDQADQDGDKVGDSCDNCRGVSNKDQSDVNGNGSGDMCDADADGDGVANDADNCWLVPNPGQERNADPNNKSRLGDVCNPDMDGDGVPNATDNCPLVYNPDQAGTGHFGKVCDYDADRDGILNAKDNCPGVYNVDQRCTPRKDDLGGRCPAGRPGDACNADIDNDGILNHRDNCSDVVNLDQKDSDNDGIGDACDKHFCFVVQRQDKGACINPDSTFQIYSPSLPFIEPNGAVDEELRPLTGRPVHLRLFANRQDVALRYTWTVVTRPEGANPIIEYPGGAVSVSDPWEYRYLKDRVATFTADLPGRYVLKVSAELVFPDTVNSNWPRNAEYQVTINAGGDAMASGCSVDSRGVGQDGAARGLALSALVGLLGFGVLVRRRRARS